MGLGAVYGARVADLLGPLGIFAWILTGFVPVLGTIVALRDAQYAWKVRDRWSLLFNVLGLVPFVEGFATFAILARVKRYHHVLHSAHQVAHATHVVRRGRGWVAASNRTTRNAVVTGAAHGAGALATVRHDTPGPLLENRVAWPALIFGLLLLLLLPSFVGLSIAATIASAGLVRLVPLAYLIAVGAVAFLVSLASLLFARHARKVARRLKERGHARPVVSWLAVMCTRVVFLITLGALALLLYGERTVILPR
jgi:hypothetical protein